MRKIYLEGGYLVLNSQEAEDLFESLVEQGTLWEYMTVLFNEKSVSKPPVEDLQQDMQSMKITMEAMMKQMVNLTKMASALPSPKSMVEPSEEPPIVIEDVDYSKVEARSTKIEAEAKPKAGNLKGALGAFAKMGRTKK